MKSNIPFGLVEAGSDPALSVSNSTPTGMTDATVQNGLQEILSTPKARRNPVTGDGVSSSDCIIRRRIKNEIEILGLPQQQQPPMERAGLRTVMSATWWLLSGLW
jgi:hypothetical protein